MKLATIQTPQGNRAVLFHDGAHIDINATDSTLPSSVKAILEAGDEVLKKVKTLKLMMPLIGSQDTRLGMMFLQETGSWKKMGSNGWQEKPSIPLHHVALI